MSAPRWLLYGATGFTGRLVAEDAARRGLTPVLCGRDEAKVRAVAEPLGLQWRVAALDDAQALDTALEGMAAVLHCAGPFEDTARPMVDACLRKRVHYCDITGEIGVFEALQARSDEARAAGITVMPGVGFDVVPTDCLAALLARDLPGATHLELAFRMKGGRSSPGTARTATRGATQSSLARIDTKLTPVPLDWRIEEIPFPSGRRRAAAIPWGDVSTAFVTTGIPNIAVFMALPEAALGWLPRLERVRRHLRPGMVAVLERVVHAVVQGPDEKTRATGRTEVWGRVRKGEEVRTRALETPEGYTTTVRTALVCVQKLALGQAAPGYETPARAFGGELILGIEGVREVA